MFFVPIVTDWTARMAIIFYGVLHTRGWFGAVVTLRNCLVWYGFGIEAEVQQSTISFPLACLLNT